MCEYNGNNLMLVKPIIDIATKYSDDVIGLGVRKWTKPKGLEGLRLAPRTSADSFSSTIKKASETFLSADSKLFSWAIRKPALSMTKVEPESLVMVHRTNYFPQNGKILSTSEATRKVTGVSEYRPTIHTSLNKSVTEHSVGNEWNSMEYSIIMPFKETISAMPKSKVIGGIQDDFFLLDSITLPKGSVILKRNADIPKDTLKVTDVFEGVKLVETSADDMVGATDLVIKKMGYTPYNEALQKYLGASSEEMKLITSMPETELVSMYKGIQDNLEFGRSLIKENLKLLENDMKEILPPEEFLKSKEFWHQQLRHHDMAEKYAQKLQDFPNAWKKFCGKQNYFEGLHHGSSWAESEIAFIGLNVLAKGSKNSWIWEGTDYKIKLLNKLQHCKVNLPKGKDIGYDIDKAISIIKNSETPEIAEKEVMRLLKIKGMPPVDRSSQLKKMGLDDVAIAEYKASLQDAPEEFQLQYLLDMF